MKPRDLLFVEAINSLGDKLRGGVNETGVEDQLARLEARIAETKEGEKKASDTSN